MLCKCREVFALTTAWKYFTHFQCLIYNLPRFRRAIAMKVLTPLQGEAETKDVDLWGAVQMPSVCAQASPIKISWKTLCVPMRKALLLHVLSSSLKAGNSWWWQLLNIGTVETSRELGNSPQNFLQRLDTNKHVNKYAEWQHRPTSPRKTDFIAQ